MSNIFEICMATKAWITDGYLKKNNKTSVTIMDRLFLEQFTDHNNIHAMVFIFMFS